MNGVVATVAALSLGVICGDDEERAECEGQPPYREPGDRILAGLVAPALDDAECTPTAGPFRMHLRESCVARLSGPGWECLYVPVAWDALGVDLRGVVRHAPCLTVDYEARALDGSWTLYRQVYTRWFTRPAPYGTCVTGVTRFTYTFVTPNTRLVPGPQQIRIRVGGNEYDVPPTLVDAVLIIDPWPGFDAPDGGPPP
jgi:hypothetical protein